MQKNPQLVNLLKAHQGDYALVLPKQYQRGKIYVLDMTRQGKDLAGVDTHSTEALVENSAATKTKHDVDMLIGRYLEDRDLYKRSKLFKSAGKLRTVHLGVDLMVPAGTEITAPLEATVHSFQDNQGLGDYGPTILLQHTLRGVTFHTLYGHLSRESLINLAPGQRIAKGQWFAKVGTTEVNGGWPTHLHFQIIGDIGKHHGDYPGVAKPSEASKYAALCPNPNLILTIKELE